VRLLHPIPIRIADAIYVETNLEVNQLSGPFSFGKRLEILFKVDVVVCRV